MVELVNCFEVPVGSEEEFLALWRRVNARMVQRPGYRGHRLHRSLTPEARYRFVNIAEWDSVEAFRAAHDEDFRAMVAGPAWARFTSTPALYEVVHAGGTAVAGTDR